jgi:penicillin-binding protein, 1A family
MKNSKAKKKTNSEELNKTKKYKIKTNKKEKDKKKHPKLKKAILIIFVLLVLLVLIGVGIIAGIFFSDKFKLTEEDLTIKNINGTVLDKDGNIIATLSGAENRKIVSTEDMPEYLPKAFIAIEDKRFYEHKGIDIKRTTYATIMYIIHHGDSASGGGSTITQQLIKNIKNDKADSGSKGIERKIREMARAYNVEKILSKDQILELYLNQIPMGSTIYGVGMAAEYYFSKPVGELDLAECAFLAGINHGPSAYNPFIGLDNADIIQKRTKEVLYQMKDQGYITSEEEYNNAVAEVENGLNFKQGANVSKASYSYHTAAAIKQVIEDLMEEKEITKETAELMVENNGYTIYTTQDTAIQNVMEEEFLKTKYIKSGKTKKDDGTLLNEHTQAAMVIIDHTTGKVVATVGGLGEDSNATGINRALRGKQTGSSMKPLACEAPALEKGIINAGTVYDDSATNFGGNYTPHNSGGFNGLMTIRTALAQSSNIVHLKIMKEVGPANAIKFLSTMGIDVDQKHEEITLALGTADVSPLNMAAAYASIANNGEYIEPTFYTKVEDASGNTVIEAKQDKRRVMSEANAYILQDLLKSPARSGTAAICYMSNMDVGAKTGSTNDYIDRWLCGFTPYYTAATWFGFDYSELPVFRGNNAANIWASVMKNIHNSLPTARFKKPSNVVYATICQDSGCIATDSCTRTMSEVFVKGSLPGKCEGHTKLKICQDSGKIANEYCKNVEEKTFLVKPQKENTNLWSTNAGDKYDVPTETCDVHKAPEKVEMMNVVGKTLTEAKKLLEAKGLKVEIKYSEDKKKKEDIVLAQSVKEKEKVEKGKTITLTVNKISKNENKVENTTTNEVTNTTTNTNTTTTNTTN